MQISSLQSSPWSSMGPFGKPGAADGDGRPAEADGVLAAAIEENQDTVALRSLEGGNRTPSDSGKAGEPPAEVFAEIWKDGMKIGAVYTDGQAELADAYGGRTLGNGAMFAQARAEALSRQVGGEIRYVDVAALQVAQVRTQLRNAYGI